MTFEQERVKQLINTYLSPLTPKWLHSSSDTVEIPCFFCGNEKNLSISLTKHIYRCWACDSSGVLHTLFSKFANEEGKSEFEKIAKLVDKQAKFNKYFNKGITYQKQNIVLPDNIKYVGDVEDNIAYDEFLAYLKYERFMSRELMHKMNVHFELKSNLIYFPSYDKLGNLNLYVTRERKTKGGKYSVHGAKFDAIFNEFMIDWKKPIYLFEGIFDACRIANSIPLLGVELNEESLLFKKIILHKVPVFIILDNEKKILKKILGLADLIQQYNSSIPIFIGEIVGDYKDVGQMEEIDLDNFKFYEYNLQYKILKSLKRL